MRPGTIQRFVAKHVIFSLLLLVFGIAIPAQAQDSGVVDSIVVTGGQRIEPDTVRSYIGLNPGDPYDNEILDAAFKRLFATGLFADVTIRADAGKIEVTVVENPIINRVVFEGNRALKEDKLREEVKLGPRQVYSRAKVRADVQRIVEMYRRKGHFAASVEPKVIQLEQNRVDLVFEMIDGPKTGIRRINFIGNHDFSDGDLRDIVATKEQRWWKFFASNDTFDPDRLAYDRELLRKFYLTQGYADFRVISGVAELTPDREDFYITFTIEEGQVYDFGEIKVESDIRELRPVALQRLVLAREGKRYNAQLIEDSVEQLTNTAGILGYAFVDIRPQVRRDRAGRKMNITFHILEAPRVYVERINIYGNVRTLDHVVRREFRLAEGDAFSSVKLERSRQRIQSLGFFQEEMTIEQAQGSTPDKVVLEVNLEERSTGQLSVGAGFSSLENFLFDFSISESNLAGRGQQMRLGLTLSSVRRQIDVSFTEPYFLGHNLAAGVDLFRTVQNSARLSAFGQTTNGIQLRSGFPLTEFISLGLRYSLRIDDLSLLGGLTPDQVSSFVLASLGNRTTSSLGYSLVYNTLDNRLRPTAGQNISFSQDVAGFGGSEKYVRSRFNYDYYYQVWKGWIIRLSAEGGNIFGLNRDVRLNDRFFLGGPQLRGFDIRGVGPRDRRFANGNFNSALGGNNFYTTGAELELPLGDAARELGIRSGLFAEAGSLWNLDIDPDVDLGSGGTLNDIIANSPSPRVTVGASVSWNSPFGPFRIDLGKVLKDQDGDETKFLQFNIGTQF